MREKDREGDMVHQTIIIYVSKKNIYYYIIFLSFLSIRLSIK